MIGEMGIKSLCQQALQQVSICLRCFHRKRNKPFSAVMFVPGYLLLHQYHLGPLPSCSLSLPPLSKAHQLKFWLFHREHIRSECFFLVHSLSGCQTQRIYHLAIHGRCAVGLRTRTTDLWMRIFKTVGKCGRETSWFYSIWECCCDCCCETESRLNCEHYCVRGAWCRPLLEQMCKQGGSWVWIPQDKED